jgi:hypothetical protein
MRNPFNRNPLPSQDEIDKFFALVNARKKEELKHQDMPNLAKSRFIPSKIILQIKSIRTPELNDNGKLLILSAIGFFALCGLTYCISTPTDPENKILHIKQLEK